MKTKSIFLISISIILISCNKRDFSKKIIGDYETIQWGSSEKLTLTPNGKYTYKENRSTCVGGDFVSVISGDYKIDGDYVLLTPQKYSEQYYEYEKRSDKKLIYDSVRDLSFLRHYYDSLLILGWNRKVFLLGVNAVTIKNNDDGNFTDKVTSFLNGFIRHDTTNFQNVFWNKVCISCTEEDLKKSLPPEWKDYLLDHEIKAQISKVDSIQTKIKNSDIVLTKPLITVDAGGKQGVHLGYQFYSKEHPIGIKIVEVHDNFSKGISYIDYKSKDWQTGTNLSTLKQKN